jgi:predicted NACHT family NTPase
VQRQIVQPLIQWMPLGGSGTLFLGFLLKQEWLQVLLTFPVTIVTAVWAAYSKSFIEQLSEIYAEKGKQDAKALSHWLGSLDEALKWQFSGFDAKYLKCQREDCQRDRPDGINQEFVPLLQEVFVPLRLTSDSRLPGYGAPPISLEEAEACRIMLIWDLLRRVRRESGFRQIAIRAWGGSGKTTLLKHITYTYAKQVHGKHRAPKLVPFLLYLTQCWSEMKALPTDDPASLPKLLTDYHLPKLPQAEPLQAPPHWARDLLRRGEALVMFDGFDEVPLAERQAVSEWLSGQMRHYRESVFIVTSRPTAYIEDYTAPRPTVSFWVEDFNDEQRRRFVEQWYGCRERVAHRDNTPDVQQQAKQKAASLLAQLEARPELKCLAGNALLLHMMVRFHQDKDGAALPQRKVELYQDICELQLRRRPEARRISLLLSSLSQRQEVLQTVALEMMRQAASDKEGFKQIRREPLLTLLGTALAERDAEVQPEAFLKQMVQVSELLVERDGGIYEFAHLSFQEFLAASEVARLKQESILYERLGLSAWKDTILFYASMVNPSQLIREALNRKAVELAYRISQDTSKRLNLSAAERRELEALKPMLQTSRYAQLEEYLKAQEWKAADRETYRLMITAVGKEEGQWFEAKELLNFPCEELRTIDSLWVRYSKGHFGFSVQKKIYVACGAKLDGNYPGKAIWEKFGDTVGWRREENWLFDYDDLNPSLSSPQGIFPSRERLRGGWWVLFSRTETCEL